MQKRITTTILVLLFFISMPVYAKKLTVDQAVDMAIQNQPSLKALNLQNESVLLGAKSLFRKLFPQISLSATYYRMGPIPEFKFSFLPSPKDLQNIPKDCLKTLMCLGSAFQGMPKSNKIGEANNFSFSVSFAQPITAAFTVYYLYKSKKASLLSSVAQLKGAKEAVKFAVRSAYYGLLQLQSTIDVLNSTLKSLIAHEKQVEDFVNSGLANRVDLLRVQTTVSQTKATLEGLKAQLKGVKSTFNALIGLDRDEDVELVDPPLPKEEELRDLKYYRAEALRLNASIAALREQAKAVRHSSKAAFMGLMPQGSLFGSYGYTYGNKFMPDWAWRVGISVQWTWDWWSTGYQYKSAEVAASAVDESIKATQISVLNEVDKAYSEVKAAMASMKYVEDAVKEAKDAKDLMEDRYRAGTATNTDCLDAQAQLLQARASKLVAKYRLLAALAYLEFAIKGGSGGSSMQGGGAQSSMGGFNQTGQGTGGQGGMGQPSMQGAGSGGTQQNMGGGTSMSPAGMIGGPSGGR